MKLKKLKSTQWAGNGFGTDAAEWQVVGTDIVIRKGVSRWSAVKDGAMFARADTRSELLEVVEAKLSKQAA